MTDAVQEKNLPVFSLDKIYVKDLSLEIPHAPRIFLEREGLQIDVQLHTQAVSIQENLFEVVVMATVTAMIGEKVVFLIETKQAGIFQISTAGRGIGADSGGDVPEHFISILAHRGFRCVCSWWFCASAVEPDQFR